jgi:shikimate dehydrogenase
MHSLSPAMHNAAFRAAGIDAVYLPLAASDFDDFEFFAEALDLQGASVTAPFKLAAFDRADAVDNVSRRVRSANTLRRVRGRWEACNTDVAGFMSPIQQEQIELQNRRATILGAGGAARAAADVLLAAGAHVSIAARRRDAAEQLANQLGCDVGEWPPPGGSWDVLVNATPAGTAPDVDASPLPDGPFTGDVVYDLVYNPPETRLLRDAKRAGCRTIGGLRMLAAQAEHQFEWWTGHKPRASAMYEAAVMAMNSRGTLSTIGTLR